MVELTCYNKACSTKGKFVESENGPEACRYHPGGPVFHDALKVRRIWQNIILLEYFVHRAGVAVRNA